MTFSPEDRYANSLPEPDQKFDVGDLALTPMDEDTYKIKSGGTDSGLTREQELLEAKRALFNKINSGSPDFIQSSAEQQNIVRDLIKERGIDIEDRVLESVVMVRDSGTHIHVVTLDGEVLGFPKDNDLRVVVQPVSYIDGGINVANVRGVEIEGESAKELIEKYKPNQLLSVISDADKIYQHQEGST